jgi:hypothetical protein
LFLLSLAQSRVVRAQGGQRRVCAVPTIFIED